MNSVPLLACFPWPVRSEPVSSRGHGRGRGTWTEGGRSWGAAALRRAAEADVPGQTARETTSGGGRYLKHRPPLGSLGAIGSDTSVPDQALTTVSNSVVLRQAGARRCSGSSASARRPSRTPKPRRSSRAPFWAKPCACLGETPRGRGTASFEMCVPPSSLSPPPLPLSSPCVGFDLPA